MDNRNSHIVAFERAKSGNGTSLMPYITYKNHLKAMDNIES